jgi:16S rRNA (adenine1518-N6/adenine1519-N6)-dimethyltransferase
VESIVAAAGLSPESTVIEVGPGLGALTARLAESAGRVIAVEVDARLAERLRSGLARRHPNLTIIKADILASDPAVVLTSAGDHGVAQYTVVGNLPYNIGAAILRHFLESQRPPQAMVVMLQREVAEAICARAGDLSLLGVSIQVYARPERILTLAPGAFEPPPKVSSSVIRLELLPRPLVPLGQRDAFFEVVRAGFSAPRKLLVNSLVIGLGRPAADVRAAVIAVGIDPGLRPQAVSVTDWLKLTTALGAA